MRFTKVPLIAILAAGALSLLAVLPALAQNDVRGQVGDLTPGADDNFHVRVLKTLATAPATAGTPEPAAPAYFDGVLYVSNSDGVERTRADNDMADADLDAVANVVRVTISDGSPKELVSTPDDPLTTNVDEEVKTECYEVTLHNLRSGHKVKAYAPIVEDGDANNGDERFATFEVIPYGQPNTPNKGCWTDSELAADDQGGFTVDLLDSGADEARKAVAQIAARNGDTIRITGNGAFRSFDLVVDGEGPEFANVAPAHKSYSSSTSARFQFTITDDGAGLRHDGEFTFDLGDTDAENVDKDNDGIRGGEPLSVARGEGKRGDALDIDLMLGGDEQLDLGTNRWRLIEVGRSYSMDVSLPLSDNADNTWRLTARDRVGNQTISDAESKDGKQDYIITVDTGKPTLSGARTGVAFSASKKKEVVDRSSVAVSLKNGDAGGPDDLSAVDHNDFRVAGHAVTGASLITVDADCNNTPASEDEPLDVDGNCIEMPKARVYLQLADELEPDEKPEVEVLGGAVLDLAGNSNDPGKITADDAIAPGLTVTINPGSEIPGRPVIRNSGQITVRVVSDEELRRRPAVWFATMKNTGTVTAAKLKIETARAGPGITDVQSADNTWERVYRANATGLSGLDGPVAVIVTGDDADGNVAASAGVSLGDNELPSVDDSLDLEDLIAGGLLIEVDDNIADPTFELAPYTDANTTESMRPFITIEFAEANESFYDVGGVGDHDDNDATPDQLGLTGVTKVRISADEDDIKLDSHEGVRITLATLDGDDVSGDLSAINSRKYTLRTSGLSIGSHTLKITGVDDAGNGVTKDYRFTVAARRPYELSLTPGWNLVSLPGTPTDPSVESVLDGAPQSKIVLSYQNDEWVTAVRVDGGGWQGTLTEIVGGYGYWIQTTAFEKVSASIPETDTSSVLPTARVTAGWNLLGVVDVEQAKAGSSPSGGPDADNYFSNLRWSVAYSYDTRQNDWTRILPKADSADDAIKNGKGYWVWATAPGTLVP